MHGERFLGRLQARSDRFERVFPTREEARRNRVLQDIALGVAVTAGLVGAVIPLLSAFGDSAQREANETLKRCQAFKDAYAPCLDLGHYQVQHFVGDMLTTGHIIFLSLVLIMAFILMTMRHLNRP